MVEFSDEYRVLLNRKRACEPFIDRGYVLLFVLAEVHVSVVCVLGHGYFCTSIYYKE